MSPVAINRQLFEVLAAVGVATPILIFTDGLVQAIRLFTKASNTAFVHISVLFAQDYKVFLVIQDTHNIYLVCVPKTIYRSTQKREDVR